MKKVHEKGNDNNLSFPFIFFTPRTLLGFKSPQNKKDQDLNDLSLFLVGV